MRFHQPIGIIQHRQSNCHHLNGNVTSSDFVINASNNHQQVTRADTIYITSENDNEKCLQTLKSIIHEKDNRSENNFDSRDVNRVTSLETFLKFKADSCGYFKNFIDFKQDTCEDIKTDLNGNGNDNVLLIETLNLTQDNLSRVSLFYIWLCRRK